MQRGIRFIFYIILLFSITGYGQDSVSIIGQLHGRCNFKTIDLNEFNVTPQEKSVMEVNDYGFFSIRKRLKNEWQMILSGSHFRFDFLASPLSGIQRISLTCRADGDYQIKLEDSPENDAFNLLSTLQQNLVKDCAGLLHQSLPHDSLRILLNQLFKVHNNNLLQVQTSYRKTYAAEVMIPACRLPENLTLATIQDSLISSILNNPGWNNVKWYNTDMMISLLRLGQTFVNPNDLASRRKFVENLLNNSPANDTAAKLYQQVVFDFFLFQMDEPSLRAYCNWADLNKVRIINAALAYKMEKLKNVLPGSILTDIMLCDKNGLPQVLGKVASKNKYTILMFWSVTCDHCKEALPALQAFYKKNHSAGTEIFAVAIDSEKGAWTKYIEENKLDWINVFEPENRLDIAASYMVNYTPTLVLCNSKGQIMSRFGDLDWIEDIINATNNK